MDQHAADNYVKSWAYMPVPFRPSDSGINIYEKSIASPQDTLLIYGGTPELADLANKNSLESIVRIDINEHIMRSMQSLATREWQRTQSVIGDWLQRRTDWDARFDIAWCDGGTLFLRFPDQWRSLFEETYQRLKSGGRFVFKSQSHPSSAPDFKSEIGEKIETFQQEEMSWTAEERNLSFWYLVADCWQLSHLGAVATDGQIRKQFVKKQMDEAASQLLEIFPSDTDHKIVNQVLGLLLNADGTTILEYLTPPELAKSILSEIGFSIENITHLPDSRPMKDYCWQVVARKH